MGADRPSGTPHALSPKSVPLCEIRVPMPWGIGKGNGHTDGADKHGLRSGEERAISGHRCRIDCELRFFFGGVLCRAVGQEPCGGAFDCSVGGGVAARLGDDVQVDLTRQLAGQ